MKNNNTSTDLSLLPKENVQNKGNLLKNLPNNETSTLAPTHTNTHTPHTHTVHSTVQYSTERESKRDDSGTNIHPSIHVSEEEGEVWSVLHRKWRFR
jgi:hypothetical protein